MPSDIIDILEAAYDVDQTEELWLERTVKAAAATVDEGLGVMGYVYDATDLEEVKVGSFFCDQRGPLASSREQVQALIRHSDPEYVARTWRGLPCSTVSETPGIEDQPGYRALVGMGVHDIFVINGIDPTWHGCWLGAGLPKVTRLDTAAQAMWSRVATHVASGFRVRRRLERLQRLDATLGADAVLDPGGKVVHAEGDAKSRTARADLERAAGAIDRARTREHRKDAEAIDEWRGLIAARWTLLDHYESDGRRYLVAQRNDASEARPPGLTDREYQVVAFLSLGHSTKLIAYDLGISDSTVRVLLARAATKLGVTSREQLVQAIKSGAFTLAAKS